MRTYEESEHDGLSLVYAMVSQLGEVVADTKQLKGNKVFVAGIPFLYTENLSADNTNILYTTFESSQLPHYWTEAINSHYHYCIVPHHSVKQAFIDSGVEIPVEVVHQSFRRLPRSRDFQPLPNVFRIGFLGVPVARKNLRKLYEACRILRSDIPSLELVVHVAKSYDWLDITEYDDISGADFVNWTSGVMTNQELADWYQNLSCYVYPSSAEGWSFTPRESVYLGVPTVVSQIPIHQELIESGCCIPITTSQFEPAHFEAGEFGQWHRVEVERIVAGITEVYNNRQEHRQKAIAGARWIEDKWLIEDMEHSLLKIIHEKAL